MADEILKYAVGDNVEAFIDGFGLIPVKIVEIVYYGNKLKYEVLFEGVQFLVDEDYIAIKDGLP